MFFTLSLTTNANLTFSATFWIVYCVIFVCVCMRVGSCGFTCVRARFDSTVLEKYKAFLKKCNKKDVLAEKNLNLQQSFGLDKQHSEMCFVGVSLYLFDSGSVTFAWEEYQTRLWVISFNLFVSKKKVSFLQMQKSHVQNQ